MSARITTKFGEAVPPAPRHAVTVHMGPKWENAEKFGADSASVVAQFHNTYPRTRPHRDIAQLSAYVLEFSGLSDRKCLLFASLQSAKQCVEYATSSKRNDGVDKQRLQIEEVQIRGYVALDTFLAVVYPAEKHTVVAGFWSTVGVGVTSRFAESNLTHVEQLREVDIRDAATGRSRFDGPVHLTLRERILSLLSRAPVQPDQLPAITASDIYFYPSGMASIYKPHSYMLEKYQGASVLFGMAFMDTLVTLEQFGPESRFFGMGSDDDLVQLEVYLEASRASGRNVQAIWVEFPGNPLLVCPDIVALRRLATKYDVILGIDDTIGSWANVDVLSVADILVTSITKSFNGYADFIGGATILNPASPKYNELKPLFDARYIPEFYVEDAKVVERNSRDYLVRTAKLNSNASALVNYLHSRARDPSSAVRRVYYPTVNSSGVNYKRFMRPETPEITPGYGCVFSVEMDDLDTTKVFYDNLNVHKSVHLGAPFTLAFAYTMCAYKKRLDWAGQFGLRPTQIRISAGLENTETLVEDFKIAVEAADEAKRQRGPCSN